MFKNKFDELQIINSIPILWFPGETVFGRNIKVLHLEKSAFFVLLFAT